MKRSGEQPKRDVAALVKHSQELSIDAKELARTADELRRKADKLMAALEKAKRARVHLRRVRYSSRQDSSEHERSSAIVSQDSACSAPQHFFRLCLMDPSHRTREIQLFEQDAELLAVYQLDLLAHLERQLRAVHHTMRSIEKLRSVKDRVGPELSNGLRMTTLAHLDEEIGALDSQIGVEHECCTDMLGTIAKMRARLSALRQRTSISDASSSDSSQSGAES